MTEPLKVGDWVVFDLKIGQIKELRDNDGAEFSDGVFSTSGRLADRFRPLTLRNKVIAGTFDYYYQMLREMDGHAGFNFPDISQYFASLSLEAIDGDDAAEKRTYEAAQNFVREARDYRPIINGIRLFRRHR